MNPELSFRPQARLPEVGAPGMAKIRAASFSIVEQASAWVEQAYLERAGARVTRVALVAEDPELAAAGVAEGFPHADAFRFSASREIGAGSWSALNKLRSVLGVAG